ncbi:F0F1 ATP synthase subunit gamma [Haematospirillum sp. H1815]|uniref:F0F1 ATP synthase subunit gamma n=1 Tax=Haematospirillum sp. H1815 TaxID=2723108 RepID=UPI00143A4F60|nr:F0F1 ATP synthase subunit gamma [Haematospirillum sp. H1815]NKD77385.1 F0F1 ATP synthase subunit gamma [Haematospirillum sp. H1815]
MASLKDLRVRINSVKNTRKITSAMKMVAASKLRRAQDAAEAGRPYAERMGRMLAGLAASVAGSSGAPKLLAGTGRDDVHLLVLMTADRGLCGGFNANVVRSARNMIRDLIAAGKTVKVLCIGRKGRDALRREYAGLIIGTREGMTRRGAEFGSANDVAQTILSMFDAGQFDVCTVIYNKFRSAISQEVTRQQLVPFSPPEVPSSESSASGVARPVYEYEPGEEEILADLLPRNVAMQVFSALLESDASEQGARMSAMDNATRNAGDMINKLTLVYNRTRQAMITKELIEIISGAEAI